MSDLRPRAPLAAAAAYYLPRHLAPNPTYPHLYPPYLIRGYPETAALENRQTIINDYITSQQMHHTAAAAMAQRADVLRGLAPRESSLALNYAAGPRGGCAGPWGCSRRGARGPAVGVSVPPTRQGQGLRGLCPRNSPSGGETSGMFWNGPVGVQLGNLVTRGVSKVGMGALAGGAQWGERRPADRGVPGSSLIKGTNPGCRPRPRPRPVRAGGSPSLRLSHRGLSLPLPRCDSVEGCSGRIEPRGGGGRAGGPRSLGGPGLQQAPRAARAPGRHRGLRCSARARPSPAVTAPPPAGIIDLSQVPHLPVLVPPTPGTAATAMDRLAYIPAAAQHFGGRLSSSPLSPGSRPPVRLGKPAPGPLAPSVPGTERRLFPGGPTHLAKPPTASSSERDRDRERERERERGSGRVEDKPSSPGDSSKKRGPKPRKEPLDPSQRPLGEAGDGLGDYLKNRKLEDAPSGPGKFPAGHSVIQLARRQDSDLAPCGGVASAGPAEATGKLALDTFPARVIKHRAAFLEAKGQSGLDPGGPRARHGSGTPGSVGGLYRDMGAQGGRPSLIARIPVARILGDPEEESWSPSLTNLEKVVVTDVTSNFLTVTIKESNTDQGFFKEKR